MALHRAYTRSFTFSNLGQGCSLLALLITGEAFDAVISYLQSDTGMPKEAEEQVLACVRVVCGVCVCERERERERECVCVFAHVMINAS